MNRPKKTRPAERTLEWLRKHGALCHKTEIWNPFGGPRLPDGTARGIRQDMWGLVDVLALWDDRTDFIQACGVDVSAHLTKIKSSVDLQARLRRILTNWPKRRFFLIGWRKRELKGKRPEWVVRMIEYTPDLETIDIDPLVYVQEMKAHKLLDDPSYTVITFAK